METAVDDELIRRNPCRIKGAGKESSAERQIDAVDQVDALADALGPRWWLMVYLGAYGSMRPEEQAELRRKDVDLDAMTVRPLGPASRTLPPGVRPCGHSPSLPIGTVRACWCQLLMSGFRWARDQYSRTTARLCSNSGS
ncbi:hypothetical protein GCM10010271_36010 [Streptomyces kurssanovii]|nr:hypothetical protein GCM10010271_36010 [Streptomyces kurssanovii]